MGGGRASGARRAGDDRPEQGEDSPGLQLLLDGRAQAFLRDGDRLEPLRPPDGADVDRRDRLAHRQAGGVRMVAATPTAGSR